MTRFHDYSFRRFVGGICVEETHTQPLTRKLAIGHCRAECERIRNPVKRRDSIVQLVLLHGESWGHRQETVMAAWAWRDGRVVRL